MDYLRAICADNDIDPVATQMCLVQFALEREIGSVIRLTDQS